MLVVFTSLILHWFPRNESSSSSSSSTRACSSLASSLVLTTLKTIDQSLFKTRIDCVWLTAECGLDYWLHVKVIQTGNTQRNINCMASFSLFPPCSSYSTVHPRKITTSSIYLWKFCLTFGIWRGTCLYSSPGFHKPRVSHHSFGRPQWK